MIDQQDEDSIDITVVVPVYRSQDSLGVLIERLEPVLRSTQKNFEVVLVNDGSPDDSWAVIKGLCGTKRWVRGLNLMRNYGQHNALLCGIREARGAFVVTMDDDLQNPPEEIPGLLDKLSDGWDVVYGTQEIVRYNVFRTMATNLTKIVLKSAMGIETARSVSAFRAFRTELREAFCDYRGAFVSIDVLLTWGTTRFAAIPVRHDPRFNGKSNYTFRKLLAHALDLMTGFSVKPLQYASLLGFCFTLFGFAVLVYVVGKYVLYGSGVQGFTFLASIIALFSGAQLISLGIIGEYLARMHFRTMDRPTYAIKERINVRKIS